jgi:multiple sugar transport system ATP-binding protein
MVFQSYALYPSMTVRENISFGLEVRKVAPAQRKAIVARVAETLQIGHLLDRRPRELSGGQRQRVAMGRALARDPTLFLFDEPLSNLDAQLRLEMRAEMKMMHRRLGKTICYVTHDQIEAMTLGDKIAVMKDGVIQQLGNPGEIYNNPVNRYVAGFIGSPPMNFIPCRIEPMGTGFGIALEAGAGRKLVPVDISALAARALNGREVLFGIRPERMTDGEDRDEGPRLDVRVELVEATGPDTLVFAQVNGTRVVSRVRPNIMPEVDSVLSLRLDLSNVLLFDPSSGERLAA